MSTQANGGAQVTFWGAAQTVTGSMHLVEIGKKCLLLDCGLFQGHRAEAHERNQRFPFRPSQVDAVILSHAHIDHCGNLPNLVRQGFPGPVFCTPATRDLVALMLTDSAKIQAEDAEYLNRRRPNGETLIRPLYEQRDVRRTMRSCQAIPYDRPWEVTKGVEVTFSEAGHLLGSAVVALRLDVGGREMRLTFTGDLGRRGLPILRDPAPIPPADLLICESTYGGRLHEPFEEMVDLLGNLVRRVADRGGKVLVPAFSVGRTQTLVYYLHQLMSEGRLPALPIFVDSPLAAAATEVFRLHPECFDDETAQLLEDQPHLFGEEQIHYIRDVEESKRLNQRRDPCIIIAASGMCEAGRILHHLKHGVGDERNAIIIVGFQAPNTLGRRLVEGRSEVRILDRFLRVKAEVAVVNGFSSHADQQDFRDFLLPLVGQVPRIRLVHGEMEQATALATMLRELGFPEVAIPDRGEVVTLV